MKLSLIKSAQRHPLCVDLDGTLVKTDTLIEAMLVLLRKNYLYFFLFPLWLAKGKLHFKFQVFLHADMNPTMLPYNKDVLKLIGVERDAGRPIVLATASPYLIAEKVAQHLGLFSTVLSSDESMNLKGARKADLLVEKYGEKGFDYIGDSRADLDVWKKADRSYVVNARKRIEKKAAKVANVVKTLRSEKSLIRLLFRQIRAHQWAKNVLIFLPMLMSYRLNDLDVWLSSFHAFAAFSLLASSVYILNDLLDLDADRKHPDNCRRPFASGDLSLSWGAILFPSLLLGGIVLSATLSKEFFAVILGYFLLTSAYSFRLKQIVLADILILASLYSWRVIAGAVASGIQMSEWFIIFAIFFFLSLALVKRSSELILMEKVKMKKNSRRGYFVSDLPLLIAFGVASGYLSILVLALYFSTPEVKNINSYPIALWGTLPFLLYWISRIWLKAFRGKMPSDPMVWAMKDRLSYSMLFIVAALWIIAKGI